jgi:hypothetical protein
MVVGSDAEAMNDHPHMWQESLKWQRVWADWESAHRDLARQAPDSRLKRTADPGSVDVLEVGQ